MIKLINKDKINYKMNYKNRKIKKNWYYHNKDKWNMKINNKI